MGLFNPSSFQLAIFKAVEDRQDNILVNAVAGSGKTTTMEHALKRVPRNERICALAFNKSIATELQKRVPDGAEATTLNSVGHRTWTRFMNGKVSIEADKIRKIAMQVVPYYERDLNSVVQPLVGKAKVHGLVPKEAADDVVNVLMEDTDDNWLFIANRYDIDVPERYGRVLELARQTLLRSVIQRSVIDFDDQLYMSIVFGAPFPTYDRIFVDEAQDLSDIQIEMLKRMVGKNTKFLFVGDRRQSLYAFRGADSKAMDRIKREFGCIELPLSITYRCPKAVVAVAQQYEPTIQAAENAPDGMVRDGGAMTNASFRPGDLIVCRTSAPVATLAFSLLGRGLRVRLQGRDLAEGLKALVKRLKPTSVDDLLSKLSKWEQQQILALSRADESPAKIAAVQDKALTLRTIVVSSGAKTVESVQEKIDGLFAGEGPCILLSTVHRAKGLEADRVFVIDHSYTPKWAAFSSEAMEQERNIKYVAVTRAKQELVFLDSGRNVAGTVPMSMQTAPPVNVADDDKDEPVSGFFEPLPHDAPPPAPSATDVNKIDF